MEDEIYLDNNATTAPLDAVKSEVVACLEHGFGNPSSPHGRGNACRATLTMARERVAGLIGAKAEQVHFVCSATEGNNTVQQSVLHCGGLKRVVTTSVEHASVLDTAAFLEDRGIEVSYLPVDGAGRVRRSDLEAALQDGPALVSIQWANSETGVVQPVEEFGELCHEYRALFHVDAAQAVGRIPVHMDALPIDFLTFTGHKLHGPQGTGVLCAKNPNWLVPLLHGGDQEKDLRAGTENVPGIVGLGRAAHERCTNFDEAVQHMRDLRDRFESAILDRVDGVSVNGDPEHRVCNTTNLRFAEIEGQALMAQLDRRGILCSQTSACTSQKPEPSYVLRRMGLSEDEAFASVRFSFSVLNTREEVDRAVEAIDEVVTRLTRFARMAG